LLLFPAINYYQCHAGVNDTSNNLSLITTMPAIFFASVVYTGEQLIAVVNNTSNKT
jgi:hypothetical protein